MESLPLGGTTSPPTVAYWRKLLASQPVEKLPLCALSLQIRHQIRRFWGFWSPICGRNELNADFFNRLRPFRNCMEMAEGVSTALLATKEAADRGFFASSRSVSEPRSGNHPDFPSKFSTHSGEW